MYHLNIYYQLIKSLKLLLNVCQIDKTVEFTMFDEYAYEMFDLQSSLLLTTISEVIFSFRNGLTH